MKPFGFYFASYADYNEGIKASTTDIHSINEAQNYCVNRERGWEVQRTKMLGLPYFVYTADGVIIEQSEFKREEVEAVFYRGDDGSKLKEPFPSIQTKEEESILTGWPLLINVPEEFTQRKVRVLDKQQTIDLLENPPSGPFFFKSRDKGFAGVIKSPDHLSKKFSFDKEAGSFCTKDVFGYINYFDNGSIVSDIFDAENAVEYRCFVINNKPVSIGRTMEDYIEEYTPRSVWKFAEGLCEALVKCNEHMVPNYVVDLALFGVTNSLLIVEFNPICKSGRYWNCKWDPLAKAWSGDK